MNLTKNRISFLTVSATLLFSLIFVPVFVFAKQHSAYKGRSRDWSRIEGRWEREGDSGYEFTGHLKSIDKAGRRVRFVGAGSKSIVLSDVSYFPGLYSAQSVSVRVNKFAGYSRVTYIQIPATRDFRYKRFWSVGSLRFSNKSKRLVLRTTKSDARYVSVVPATRVLLGGAYYPYTAAYDWYGPARVTGYILPSGQHIITEVAVDDNTDPEAFIPGIGITYDTVPVVVTKPVVVERQVIVTKPVAVAPVPPRPPKKDSVQLRYDSRDGLSAQFNVNIPLK